MPIRPTWFATVCLLIATASTAATIPKRGHYDLQAQRNELAVTAQVDWQRLPDRLRFTFKQLQLSYGGPLRRCRYDSCPTLANLQIGLSDAGVQNEGLRATPHHSQPLDLPQPLAFGDTVRLPPMTLEVMLNDAQPISSRRLPYLRPALSIRSAENPSWQFDFATQQLPLGRVCRRTTDLHALLHWGCNQGLTRWVRTAADPHQLAELRKLPGDDVALSPLARALFWRNTEQVIQLLKAGANPNQREPLGGSPLLYGAWHGEIDGVRAMLANKAEVNQVWIDDEGQNGRSALSYAVIDENLALTKLLLAYGANPYLRAADGWSPLAQTIRREQRTNLLDAMLRNGLQANRAARFQFLYPDQDIPPLLAAIGAYNPGAAARLLQAGAQPWATGPYQYPVAHFAAYWPALPVLKAMAQAGLKLQHIIPDGPHAGEDMLMHAAEGGQTETIRYLLSKGLVSGRRDAQGRTAADHASTTGHPELAQLLRDAE